MIRAVTYVLISRLIDKSVLKIMYVNIIASNVEALLDVAMEDTPIGVSCVRNSYL